MADVAESGSYADAASAISQGKRHLLVQDYTAAVTAFAEGLEMMSQKLGECDDELGEPYLLYGRALLGLAREEAGVLGGGVPGSEDAEDAEDAEDVEEDEDGEEEKLSDVDEKDEDESEETEGKKSAEASGDAEKKAESEAAKKEDKKEEKKEDKKEEKKEEKKDENKSEEKDAKPTSNETDDTKMEEQKLQKSPAKVQESSAAGESSSEAKKTEAKKPAESVESVAGSSKVETNGSASKAEKSCNGSAPGRSSDDVEDGEDVNKEDDDEDAGRGDLQVAWEVLELAKIVFAKRGEAGLKNLAETHRLLGEVAMESDNPQGAITDFEGALKLLQKMEPCEPRAIAELHYQLGLAHSLLNDFDASIGQFKEATTLLKARIKQLESIEEPPKNPDDPFYTVEGEIKELKELLPAIQEKINDIEDFKEEACLLVIEGIKNKVAGGGCTNGAGSSGSNDGAGSSSSSQPAAAAAAASAVSPKNAKPASDISHLVRKKRKADEVESPTQSPCKKPTP